MQISYLADLPETSTLMLAEGVHIPDAEEIQTYGGRGPEKWTPHLFGRFSGRQRKVFEDYYRDPESSSAPHLLFAGCGTTNSEIQEFTADWGLIHNPGMPSDYIASMPIGLPWKGDKQDFALDLEWWRHLHSNFKTLIALIAECSEGKNAAQDRSAVTKLFHHATTYMTFANSFPITPSLASVEETWVPVLRVGSLWMAFCMMLLLDLSAKGRLIKSCENPTCRKFFSTSRDNKKYCSHACGVSVARRVWWRKEGKQRREQSRRSGRTTRLKPRT